MELFRLTRSKYAQSLSGVGAAKYGARWNSKGVEMLYTAANRSLAMAEVAVHFSIAMMPRDYMMLTLFVPDDVAASILTSENYPDKWNRFPVSVNTQRLGDQFIQDGKSLMMRVPSAVTQGDFNYLINPAHPDFHRVKIVQAEQFVFDQRLFT